MSAVRGVSVPMYTALRRTTVVFTMVMERLLMSTTHTVPVMGRSVAQSQTCISSHALQEHRYAHIHCRFSSSFPIREEKPHDVYHTHGACYGKVSGSVPSLALIACIFQAQCKAHIHCGFLSFFTQ